MAVIKPPKITLRKLRRLVVYDSKTGQLLWRRRRGSHKKGSPCGFTTKDGYLAVRIERRNYPVHRLIWWMQTGEYPIDKYIDHRDGNRMNNRFENFRAVTPGENNQNTRKTSLTSSRYKGVLFKNGKWTARLNIGRKQIHLGVYDTEWDALVARLEAEEKHNWKDEQNHNVNTALKEIL